MLETAESGPKLSPKQYAELEPQLRTALIDAQQKLRTARFPVIVIISGDDPFGTRALLNLISEWMDTRFIATRVFAKPTEEELSHPPAWRYWRELPPNGRIAVFADEWTTHVLAQRLRDKISSKEFTDSIDSATRFERMLAADDTLFVKFFVHLDPKSLQDRHKRVDREARTSEVASIARSLLKHPSRTRTLIEQTLSATSIAGASWNLLDGTDKRSLEISAARILLESMRAHLHRKPSDAATRKAQSATVKPPTNSVLDKVDLSEALSDKAYDQEMSKLRRDLGRLTERAAEKSVPIVCAFEGWDAAGKGGTIRRLAYTMNPEQYRIVPVAAPTDEEKAHHYLWRFWRHIPRDGEFVIFDRTWYGRVLVERVEGFSSPDQWQRAYEEITYFEQRLTDRGAILLKFWLHISKDEQLRRFKDRENTPFKRYKIGPEDYRNRDKWDQYVDAINDMVARTSTANAPWHLVASNDKQFGRVQVLQTVADALRKRLK